MLSVILLISALSYTQKVADAFLWVYFTGNEPAQEQIRFATSTNGFDFKQLNKGNPVINSSVIAEKKAIRDPHIYRAEDGTFYMVCTDMKSNEGWLSNHGIVMLKSKDLIDWTYSRVNIRTAFPNEFGNIDAAWAPQTIYDPVAKKYMVYFSMHHQPDEPSAAKAIYYSYANADFTKLDTVPKQLYIPPKTDSNIDGDVVLKDGTYYLFFKTEQTNKILLASSKNVTGPYTGNQTPVQLTNNAAEGSCCYPLGDGRYVLMYDVYADGKYEFTTTKDMKTFTLTKATYDFTPRHGTIMQITAAERDRLIKKWG